MFEKAVSLDSNFGLAYARLAHVYTALFSRKHPEYGRKCEASLENANRLQPDLPQIHLARGAYLEMVKKDLKGALVELEAARTHSPNDVDVLAEIANVQSTLDGESRSMRGITSELWPFWTPTNKARLSCSVRLRSRD